MKNSKRLLSLLLVLVMIAALMPTFAAAETADAESETVHGSDALDQKILQFAKTRPGNGRVGDNYKVNPQIDRHILKAGSDIDYVDWGYGDSNNFLIPHGTGIVKATLFRTQNVAGNAGTRDINRWWRWNKWVNNSVWKDDSTDGMYVQTRGTRKIFGDEMYDRQYVVKSGEQESHLFITTNTGWHDIYQWTGGAFDGVDYADVYIDSSLPVGPGSVGELWSSNGTRAGSEVAQSWTLGAAWVLPGDIGKHVFAIAESHSVVYDLDGGNINGDTNDQRYICWNTGDASTSQLHDIIQEPSKEHYSFLGWRCVDNGGNTNLTVGDVYQPAQLNHSHSNDGKISAGCITVSGDIAFEAVWAENDFFINHVQNGVVTSTDPLDVTDYGDYQVVAYNKPREYVPDANRALDVTGMTSEGFLYGGTFTDENGTEIITDNPKKLSPKAGNNYYVWEVSDEHLQPMCLAVWDTVEGGYDVTEVYLFSAIDRLLYQETGFVIDGKDTANNAIAYNKIKLATANVELTYNQINPKAASTKNSLITCSEVVNFKNGQHTMRPYWVTLDGVTVYGDNVRTFSYNGIGNQQINKQLTISDTYIRYTANAPVRTTSFAPLMLMSCYNPGTQTDPIDIGSISDEPEVPEVPEVPEEPEQPEVKAMLNVVDGSKTYEVEISEGMALTPAGEKGKLFAGWYADSACTAAADLSAVSDGDTVYAKYVSDSYLQVKFSFNLLNKTLSLSSAVDSKNYAETGYVISTKSGDKKVAVGSYASKFALQNAKQLFGVGKNDPLMNVDYKLSGISKNDNVTVTPYLVTADGTTVYGTARTLTYTGLTMRG